MTQTIFTDKDIEYCVKNHGNDLFQYALVRVGDVQIAEDLIQEAFLSALQNKTPLSDIKNQKAWLMAILKNKLIDYYRVTQRKQKHEAGTYSEQDLDIANYFTKRGMWEQAELPKEWSETEDLLSDNDFCSVLNACLDKLPPQYHQIVRLKIMQNEDSNEICEDLGISPTNLWQLVHRTKLRLRKCINKYWFQN